MRRIALLACRDLTVDGIPRATGEIFEMDPIPAVIAMRAHGHGLAFAKEQPKAERTQPKSKRRYQRRDLVASPE